MLETVWQDVRYVLRSLRRAPGFALVSIGSLAVGVGFAVFTFNFVQQALAMSTVPAVRSGRLVDVFTNQLNGTAYGTSSYPDIQDIRSRSDIFDAVVAYSPYSAALNVDGATRMAFGEIVTGNYFRVLGIETMLGRPIVPADDQPGAPRVVVLSQGAWRRHFGSSRSVLGRVLRIRNQSYTIVGVASSGYSGAAVVPVDFWTAMTWAEDAEPVGIIDTTPSPGKSRLDRRGDRWLFVKGRLAPGQTAASTRTALEALMTRLGTEYPATNAMRRFTTLDSRAVRIHPVVDFAIAPASTALGVVVLLVLVVVSTNVSGLLLARGTARQREIAIRFAVGASRSRVVRHLLTESVLVAAIGGGAALWLMWTLTVIGRDIATIAGAPFTIEPRLGTSSLWFGVALALATGIAAGLAPALRTTIRSRLLLTGSSPLASTRHSRWTLRDSLIAIQTAAAFVLLVTAGLLTRSTLVSERADLGFRTDAVATLSTGTAVLGYDVPKATAFYDLALTRIRAIPGIQAALVGRAPLDPSYSNETIFLSDLPAPPEGHGTEYTATVSAEYFDVLDIRIVDGRNFTVADTRTSPRVTVVTQAFARKYWPGERAVGKRFHARTADGPEYEIVGVSADYTVVRPGESPTPYIHFAIAQHPSTEWRFLIRDAAGTTPPIDRVRRELRALDPGLLLDGFSMRQGVNRVLLPLQAAALGLSSVGLVTILFAAIGLYGVISFMVTRRTREFGVRMAIGASPSQMLFLVIRHGLAIGAIGTVLGAFAAAGAAAMLANMLYGVSAADPLTWITALAVVFAISLCAHLLPARRASAIDPAIALRSE